MAATIEKAEANNPTALKLKIAALRIELEQTKKARPVPATETKTVEKFVLKDGQLARFEQAVKAFAHVVDTLTERAETARDRAVEAMTDAYVAIQRARAPQPDNPTTKGDGRRAIPSAIAARPASVPAMPRQPTNAHASGERLPPGEHATLTAALQYDGLDRKRLSVLTGYKRSSRDAYIARLVAKGLIDVQGQALFPTDAGRAALNGSFEPLPTGADLIEYWRARLPEGERRTIEAILAVAPGADVERESIDTATGYKRSSRDAYLTRLKARGLVEFSGRGTVRASQELFS
jgi:hypothetical protein